MIDRKTKNNSLKTGFNPWQFNYSGTLWTDTITFKGLGENLKFKFDATIQPYHDNSRTISLTGMDLKSNNRVCEVMIECNNCPVSYYTNYIESSIIGVIENRINEKNPMGPSNWSALFNYFKAAFTNVFPDKMNVKAYELQGGVLPTHLPIFTDGEFVQIIRGDQTGNIGVIVTGQVTPVGYYYDSIVLKKDKIVVRQGDDENRFKRLPIEETEEAKLAAFNLVHILLATKNTGSFKGDCALEDAKKAMMEKNKEFFKDLKIEAKDNKDVVPNSVINGLGRWAILPSFPSPDTVVDDQSRDDGEENDE